MTSRREPWTEARSTAIHEAGHAVAAFSLGLRIKSVHVIPDEDVLGAVLHYPPGAWFQPDLELTDRVRLRIERHVMVSWAGTLSEQKWA